MTECLSIKKCWAKASRLWTPPTRPERLKRPDTGRSDTGQSDLVSNATKPKWVRKNLNCLVMSVLSIGCLSMSGGALHQKLSREFAELHTALVVKLVTYFNDTMFAIDVCLVLHFPFESALHKLNDPCRVRYHDTPSIALNQPVLFEQLQ